ncbi:hypothetical protein B0J11DRAFT_224195 [Dendryphion nanum]|uniref:Uncharacterized protein n=1 Tax=Dendryphion nanum TaxID=256645 RepID=A0A9P9E7Z9_9PLEO|nr:hypothetical protein B0J11DRAFT_224195 [Dendryphion nanum]
MLKGDDRSKLLFSKRKERPASIHLTHSRLVSFCLVLSRLVFVVVVVIVGEAVAAKSSLVVLLFSVRLAHFLSPFAAHTVPIQYRYSTVLPPSYSHANAFVIPHVLPSNSSTATATPTRAHRASPTHPIQQAGQPTAGYFNHRRPRPVPDPSPPLPLPSLPCCPLYSLSLSLRGRSRYNYKYISSQCCAAVVVVGGGGIVNSHPLDTLQGLLSRAAEQQYIVHATAPHCTIRPPAIVLCLVTRQLVSFPFFPKPYLHRNAGCHSPGPASSAQAIASKLPPRRCMI